MKILFPLLLILIFGTSGAGQQSSDVGQTETQIVYEGIGDSFIGKVTANWEVRLLEEDSVILTCSYRKNDQDLVLNNLQLYGRLTPSKSYTYEVDKSLMFFGIGCDMPAYKYMLSDSVPIYVEPDLLELIGNWKVEATSTAGSKNYFTVENVNTVFNTLINNKLDTTDYYLNFKSEIGLLPMTLRSGYKCQVNITNIPLFKKFYINELTGGYQLLIDKGNRDLDIIELSQKH